MVYIKLEKAILVGVNTDRTDQDFIESMNELHALAETAGADPVLDLIQNMEKVHPATFIGKGKLEELISASEELEPELIIFNSELSPSQNRNLSEVLSARVIDRTQLILDIFAQRARSKEGKLQVQLAQLEYMLPRLGGQGVELSRLGGGIGTRGPGETKLETDRRHIRREIREIKKKLEQVVRHRSIYRERRKQNQAFQIALIGYTNAGKSTLFNLLTYADSFEENQLFATLDPLSRKCILPSGFETIMTDTVGFIKDLPTSLIASFRSTLEEVKEADFLLHVVDASHPNHADHEKTVKKLLNDLEMDQIPRMTVYNKEDLLSSEFVADRSDPFVLMSAAKKESNKVLVEIEKEVKQQFVPYNMTVSSDDGKVLAQLKKESMLLKLSFIEEEEHYLAEGYISKDHPLAARI
ncbi:GTPase [Jeotgalibacillus malaysiensis]|uniref:GTPase HflX n=1 Tax=Jeotgalibacillus malaysiensis TaxID=1508404 RepID=A0A0B5AST8_9BACL|nr:GTPase HflX [Jeotgalibacillus malaysiensis]AJD91094.1 GTPase [Jeotgalibacillus malaysiensis]